VKTCSKCKKEYPKTDDYFFRIRVNSHLFRSNCKKCMADANREQRKKPIISNTDESIKKKCAMCGKEFPATTDHFFKGHCKHGLRSKCKVCFYAENRMILARPGNIEKSRVAYQKHYADNKEEYAERWQKYYEANAEHIKRRSRDWGKNNLDKRRITDRKRNEDPKFRLSRNISSSIRQSLFRFNGKGGAPWESLVDFTKQEIIDHLEKQFQPGMTWDNYGEWQIDHRVPISVFNFTTPEHEDFSRCWSLKNLQPMWAKENMSKSAKLEKHFQPRLALGAAC